MGTCPKCGSNGATSYQQSFECWDCDYTTERGEKGMQDYRADMRKISRTLTDIKAQLVIMNRLRAMEHMATLSPEEKQQYLKDLGIEE